MKKLLLIGLMLAFCVSSRSQDVVKSRRTSYYTYIYQLTDKEALKIYKKGLKKVEENFFHTLVHSYPTDSLFDADLKPGHYLRTWAKEEDMLFELISVSNVDVRILNNGTDFNVVLYDSSGIVVMPDNVSIDGKTVPFDKKTQTYRLKKTNRKGVLSIKYNGITSFTYVKRQINNPTFRRITNKVLFTVPLKYVAIPVNLIIRSPYDLYKTVRYKRFYGIYHYITKPFKDVYHSIAWGDPQGFVQRIACIFDDYHCNDNEYFNGFVVFNKPKYLPGDTVKFKAYIITKSGRPVNKSLKIILSQNWDYKTRKELTTLKPYRKGAYEWEFVLHDSLQLKLDTNYKISFQKENGSELNYGEFYYEEYELKSNKFEAKADAQEHHLGQNVVLTLSGTDINGLNLYDIRTQITLLSKNVKDIFNEQVIVPDTLWTHNQPLEQKGETTITLPDSIFPAANLDYEVKIIFLNSENEKREKSLQQSYFYKKDEIEFTSTSDTLHVSHKINGTVVPEKGSLTIFNKEEGEISTQSVDLPTKIIINPFASSHDVKIDSLYESWELERQPSLVECLTKRTADSVFIKLKNPRKIVLRYFIYEKNNEIHRGSGYTLNYKTRNSTKAKYFISLQYIWGGEVKSENYEIPFHDRKLGVKVYQPGTIYPGQETDVKILVQDAKGKPVPNADLTALSFTSKFEQYSIPALPYLGKTYKNRTLINNFTDAGNTLDQQTQSMLINWQLWNVRMQLDTIEYFKFLFPAKGSYHSTVNLKDSITQFAPYLVCEGKIEPIHIIYLDNRPIYFSFAQHLQRYSFAATHGVHHLRLRTAKHEVTIDSVCFEPFLKNVFSFLLDENNKLVKISERKTHLTEHENNVIKNNMISVYNEFGHPNPAYIKQNSNVFWINHSKNFARNILIGPVRQQPSWKIHKDVDSVYFDLEQRYSYIFKTNHVKMKYNEDLNFNSDLEVTNVSQSIADSVLTERELLEMDKREASVKQSIYNWYDNPKSTGKGNGKAVVKLPLIGKQTVKNYLILKDDDTGFLRVYGGSGNVFHDLEPGSYSIYSLLLDDSYIRKKNIIVQKDASTYIIFKDDIIHQPDSTSMFINKQIKGMMNNFNYVDKYRKEKAKEITQAVLEEEKVTFHDGVRLQGIILSREDGEPLPGVNVMVKGTTVGTTSDMNGRYSLFAPKGSTELVFSFIGFTTEEISIGTRAEINAKLSPDIKQLQEVVVIGYGMMKKRELTGSIATVTSTKQPGINMVLQGRVAGVQVEEGGDIRIRGVATIGSGRPLFVINGVPYDGDDLQLSPDQIKGMEVLKDAAATAIYGARAANGVVIITLKENSDFLKTVLSNNTFMEAVDQSSSIRSNFSDYAMWQPSLRTDKNGMATFKVKYPDDITAWNTHVLGITHKKQTGQYQGEVKSFKPVAGTLSIPRFLIDGDSTALIGKALNYTPDTLDINVNFHLNDVVVLSQSHTIENLHVDTLNISASAESDSLKVKYVITRSDGYFDGEERFIPVYQKGAQESKGFFFTLDNDTSFIIKTEYPDKEVYITAKSNVLEVLMEEAEIVKNYPHLCNEQAASKIKALLALKKIAEVKKEKFKYDDDIRRLVRKLENSRVDNLWGWWPNSSVSYWISLHVLEAMFAAEQAGYKVDVNKVKLTDFLVWQLEKPGNRDRIRIMQILNMMKAKVDYAITLEDVAKDTTLAFSEYLKILMLRQDLKLPYKLDTIWKRQHKTIYGNLYWKDLEHSVYTNNTTATLYVYQLLKKEGNHQETLSKIRNCFLEERRSGYWRNTYEAANIIETILPDLLADGEKVSSPALVINGNKNVEKFPYNEKQKPSSQISVRKTGTGPVYLLAYQNFWIPDPQPVKNDFIINSYFEGNRTNFEAGKEVVLLVDVKVKKEADYLMIEVPVPGGFSYGEKLKTYRFEDHREYYKHKVSIFCSKLREGEYQFKIKLLPRYSGSYSVNPAKIEMMYFPVFFGRDEIKKVSVR